MHDPNPQPLTCYNPNNNPQGAIPPPDYKIYICDWNGLFPSSFSGTWYCTGGTGTGCGLYPSTPTAVTFTPKTCLTSYEPPDPPSGALAVPFSIIITDPTVPEYFDFHDQSLAISVTGIVPAHPTGVADAGCTCGSGTIFLGYTFLDTGFECSFRLEITSVVF